jgi:lysozyme
VKINIKDWIKNHEGLSLTLYKDTVNKTTIGYGRNIEDEGISKEEADFMFDNDFSHCQRELLHYNWYTNQPENVQAALMDMCFNLGITRLLEFKAMIAALIDRNYTKASIEALRSKWASEVGQRAKDVALMMREGYNDTSGRTD